MRTLLLMVFLTLPVQTFGQPRENFGPTTVMEFLKVKDKWGELASKKTKVVLSGRYGGRISDRFRFDKFPVNLQSSRIARLPTGIQTGQRISVTAY